MQRERNMFGRENTHKNLFHLISELHFTGDGGLAWWSGSVSR